MENMDIDGTSSASSDSSPSQFGQNLSISANFYNDSMYFSNSKKSDFDNYFNKEFYGGDKADRKVDAKCSKRSEFCIGKKDDFCASASNTRNNEASDTNKNRSDQFSKRDALFSASYGKKVDELVDNRKVQSNYFSKKNGENANIHLNNLDLFGKKQITFSADQVNTILFKHVGTILAKKF